MSFRLSAYLSGSLASAVRFAVSNLAFLRASTVERPNHSASSGGIVVTQSAYFLRISPPCASSLPGFFFPSSVSSISRRSCNASCDLRSWTGVPTVETRLEVLSRLDVALDDALAAPETEVGLLRVHHLNGHVGDAFTARLHHRTAKTYTRFTRSLYFRSKKSVSGGRSWTRVEGFCSSVRWR
ncbi:hypothetical protein TYRP_002915 [Tyrophagus putrescentiae]|nr:hypothetical protein TYRP_002915 [Tyrophagus putrescentiae]